MPVISPEMMVGASSWACDKQQGIQKMFDQNTAAWGLGVESASGIKKAMKTQAIFCDTVATDGSSWSLTPEAELNPRNKPTLADELRSNSRICVLKHCTELQPLHLLLTTCEHQTDKDAVSYGA